jgi:NadR type nicotinamide-nucleotide adenylyltransferase
MTYDHGLVIGKFLPPHRGHRHLIESAAARVRRLTAIVCARRADAIPAALRARWLRALHPRLEVRVIDDVYDPDDSRVWAENTVRWLGRAPDVVFSSEDYGERYARWMGCRHVLVDRRRTVVPCSATRIRDDPYAHWEFLDPPVRGWYAKRVCVVGAESTGTTTLARDLARHWQTVWVPEYGREYSEGKFARGDAGWRSEEFLHIARRQNRNENAAACAANRVLICDTNALATVLWHRRYVGTNDPRLERIAAARRADLFLLTGDEIPFVQDGLRDGQHIRHEMHRWFEETLRAQSTPWLLVRGDPQRRLAAADRAVRELFAGSRWKGPAAEPGGG